MQSDGQVNVLLVGILESNYDCPSLILEDYNHALLAMLLGHEQL